MKVSVLMPTYNDEKYIGEAIESVLIQEDIDVELIIINDGSTDDTEKVIKSFKSQKIKYISQENKGQLNALFMGIKYITGDFVCVLHSDDLIVSKKSFRKNVDFILRNKIDGCYSDYVKFNEKCEENGILKVERKFNSECPLKLLLLKGSNFIGDPFFVTRKAFYKTVVRNYIVWNMPYWFCESNGHLKILNLKYIPEPWYKYRVYSENYIHSEIGKLEVFNGVARTIITLSEYYSVFPLPYRNVIPTKFYRLPSYNRLLSEFSLNHFLERVLKTYGISKDKNNYFKAVVNSYKTKSDNIIRLKDRDLETVPLFFGKDARLFFTKFSGMLGLYEELIQNAICGKFTVLIDKHFEKKIKILRRFLNINFEIKTI